MRLAAMLGQQPLRQESFIAYIDEKLVENDADVEIFFSHIY